MSDGNIIPILLGAHTKGAVVDQRRRRFDDMRHWESLSWE